MLVQAISSKERAGIATVKIVYYIYLYLIHDLVYA